MKLLCLGALVVAASASGAWAEKISNDPMRQAAAEMGQQQTTLDRICGASATADKSADKSQDYADFLAKALLLSDDQKRALKDYEDTQSKAIADGKSRLCDHKPDLSTFQANLDFRQKMLEDQLDTIKAVNPKLLAFYNGLNEEQKARFDQMRQGMTSRKRK